MWFTPLNPTHIDSVLLLQVLVNLRVDSCEPGRCHTACLEASASKRRVQTCRGLVSCLAVPLGSWMFLIVIVDGSTVHAKALKHMLHMVLYLFVGEIVTARCCL